MMQRVREQFEVLQKGLVPLASGVEIRQQKEPWEPDNLTFF